MNTSFFLPYQRKWICDNSRIKIMEKSRQIGLSWCCAYRAIREALLKPKTQVWICSRDKTQANLFLNDCKDFAKVFSPLKNVFDTQTGSCKEKLRFKNQSIIHTLSSNPNAQAGKRGTRILDEFALHEDPETLYNIAYPGITWGGQLEIISTHRGSNNFFNKLIQEVRLNGNPKKISLHRVTLVDALEQGFLKKLKSKLPIDDPRQNMTDEDYYNFIKNACASESIFLQEYMCQPMNDDDTFLKLKDIEACFYDPKEAWQEVSHYPCYLGVDLARSKDLTVFIILEKKELCFFTREVICLKNRRFEEQERIFSALLKTYNIQHVCIDKTGIGQQFVERMQSHFGTQKIEGITFSTNMKERLAYSLKNIIEHRQIFLPQDYNLVEDLLQVRTQWAGDNIRFNASHTHQGHSDRFWALALAICAAQKIGINSLCATELLAIQQNRYL